MRVELRWAIYQRGSGFPVPNWKAKELIAIYGLNRNDNLRTRECGDKRREESVDNKEQEDNYNERGDREPSGRKEMNSEVIIPDARPN